MLGYNPATGKKETPEEEQARISAGNGSAEANKALADRAALENLRKYEAQKQADAVAKQAAEKAANDAKMASSSGQFYNNLNNQFQGINKPPGLDTGLYNQANANVDGAQRQAAGDMQMYQDMISGRAQSLGAQQARAGAQQAANAQLSMGNSARGGLYNQAAANQSALTSGSLSKMQGNQQAQALNEEAKIAGMGLYSQGANANRDVGQARANIDQNMGLISANQQLGYQGIGDATAKNLSNIGLGVDQANQTNAMTLGDVISQQEIAQRQRDTEEKAKEDSALWSYFKTGAKVIGSVYTGGLAGGAAAGATS
jgi:hypothetical protein